MKQIEIDAIWLAGVWDCLGYAALYRKGLQITFKSMDEDRISAVAELIGARVTSKEPEEGGWAEAPVYRTQRCGKAVEGILREILPYVRVPARRQKIVSILNEVARGEAADLS